MGKVREQSDFKSQLVLEICSIPATCAHRPRRTHFVDWYLLLRVDEDADIDTIRKQYLKFALQLHPDKNKHPQAEIAFKLVSDAYTCLSDNAKRGRFHLERLKTLCTQCNKIHHPIRIPPTNSTASKHNKGSNPTQQSRANKILRNLKNMRDRFKEEARVIENCLRTNASENETPLFNPINYHFNGYPHHRTQKESPLYNPSDYSHLRTPSYKKSDNVIYMKTGNMVRRGKHDMPIFELKSERKTFPFVV